MSLLKVTKQDAHTSHLTKSLKDITPKVTSKVALEDTPKDHSQKPLPKVVLNRQFKSHLKVTKKSLPNVIFLANNGC